jgi:hypothetical protein
MTSPVADRKSASVSLRTDLNILKPGLCMKQKNLLPFAVQCAFSGNNSNRISRKGIEPMGIARDRWASRRAERTGVSESIEPMGNRAS